MKTAEWTSCTNYGYLLPSIGREPVTKQTNERMKEGTNEWDMYNNTLCTLWLYEQQHTCTSLWISKFNFSVQPVLHDWCNKGHGMCYPVCWMVHIKEPLLLIGKSCPCGGSGFPLSLSEWSFTICLMPYTRK